ncbi:MAG: hypothetical protein EOP11_03765 [Proteobacteria bacterium]|nr:MAG: hypothetical protein EOP11_03765 [Pseudomonadota bacterium]
MKKSFVRVKIYRPRTPFFLRPEVWVGLACLAYFTYEKVSFYAPLAYEQNFPRGATRALSTRLEEFLTEQGVGQQTWALPINDFLKSGGQCVRMVPGPEEAPDRISRGAPIVFSSTLATESGGGAVAATYQCSQDKIEKFSVTIEGKGLARIERGHGIPLGLNLEEGTAVVKALPGAELEVLLPNGYLSLNSEKGFTATLSRREGLLGFVVNEGVAEATPRFTLNYRGEGLGLDLSAEGKAKLRLPNRSPAGAGKAFRAVPSGTYAQTK